MTEPTAPNTQTSLAELAPIGAPATLLARLAGTETRCQLRPFQCSTSLLPTALQVDHASVALTAVRLVTQSLSDGPSLDITRHPGVAAADADDALAGSAAARPSPTAPARVRVRARRANLIEGN